MRTHIALFSQTGTEIVNIATQRNKWPDCIITNDRPSEKREMHLEIRDKEVITLPNTPTVEDYRSVFSKYENPLITLHGWLRIIPKEVCEEYEIINGHPGDIVTYPILKGKDPQMKAFNLNLPYSGAVLHRVTAEVDSGAIIALDSVYIKELNLSEIFHTLHALTTNLWVMYLPRILNEEEHTWY